MDTKKVILLLQLDKPLYKPSDVVKFRIFAIDMKTKPYSANYSKVCILNSKNNAIFVMENVNFKMGVFEGKFEFVDVATGMYEILVEADGTVSLSIFLVTS